MKTDVQHERNKMGVMSIPNLRSTACAEKQPRVDQNVETGGSGRGPCMLLVLLVSRVCFQNRICVKHFKKPKGKRYSDVE